MTRLIPFVIAGVTILLSALPGARCLGRQWVVGRLTGGDGNTNRRAAAEPSGYAADSRATSQPGNTSTAG